MIDPTHAAMNFDEICLDELDAATDIFQDLQLDGLYEEPEEEDFEKIIRDYVCRSKQDSERVCCVFRPRLAPMIRPSCI